MVGAVRKERVGRGLLCGLLGCRWCATWALPRGLGWGCPCGQVRGLCLGWDEGQ